MKKTLVILSKPVAPPWNDGSKVMARDLCEAVNDRNIIIPTICGVKTNLTNRNIKQIPVFSNVPDNKPDFINKLMVFFFMLKIPKESFVHILLLGRSECGLLYELMEFYDISIYDE